MEREYIEDLSAGDIAGGINNNKDRVVNISLSFYLPEINTTKKCADNNDAHISLNGRHELKNVSNRKAKIQSDLLFLHPGDRECEC
jgi:hypothetical protein